MNPQTENGYTRIANEILEVLAKTPFNGTQRRILDVVFRSTYGFHKKEHEISIRFLLNAMGMNESQFKQVKRELDKLIEKRVILETKKPTKITSRIVRFNKNHLEWTIQTTGQNRPVDELDHSPVDELDHSPVVELDHQKRNYKDIYKEREREEKNEIREINNKFYEFSGQDISSDFYQNCEAWLEQGIKPELILKALAKGSNKSRPCSYATTIIRDWIGQGITTVEQLLEADQIKARGTIPLKKASNCGNIFTEIGREEGWWSS